MTLFRVLAITATIDGRSVGGSSLAGRDCELPVRVVDDDEAARANRTFSAHPRLNHDFRNSPSISPIPLASRANTVPPVSRRMRIASFHSKAVDQLIRNSRCGSLTATGYAP